MASPKNTSLSTFLLPTAMAETRSKAGRIKNSYEISALLSGSWRDASQTEDPLTPFTSKIHLQLLGDAGEVFESRSRRRASGNTPPGSHDAPLQQSCVPVGAHSIHHGPSGGGPGPTGANGGQRGPTGANRGQRGLDYERRTMGL